MVTVPKHLLTEIRNAPLLSQSVTQLLSLMNHSNHGVSDITRIVECDAPLTGRILKVVNSAAYSLPKEIDTISRAVAYLGDKTVVSIALSFACAKVFDKKLEGYQAMRGEFWAHNLRTAIASRLLCRYATISINADLAYTGGLLHDIGKSVISDYLAHTPNVTIGNVPTGDFLDLEQKELGADHCEIGLELAKFWKLPESLRDIIRWHHDPSNASEAIRHMAYAVHLGDIVAMMGGNGTGIDFMNYKIDESYPDYIKISPDELALTLLDVEQEFRRIESSLN